MGRFSPSKPFAGCRYTCCWCGANPLPKGRLKWCSDYCVDQYLGLCPTGPKGYIFKTLLRDQGACQSCGIPGRVPLWPMDRETKLQYDARSKLYNEQAGIPIHEVDHIIPVIEGGSNELSNLRTLCRACHQTQTASLLKRLAKNRKDKS